LQTLAESLLLLFVAADLMAFVVAFVAAFVDLHLL
jgi:hypothetical protein